MRLKGNLFTVVSRSAGEDWASYEIELNAEHTIYKAHFPGNPVTPGVCIIGIAKELLEDTAQTPLEICSIKNVKFVSVLSPATCSTLTCELKNIQVGDVEVKAQATLSCGEVVFAKLSFTCRPRDAKK